MPTKPKKKANPECEVCKGRGWFYAGDIRSPWPAECFRCFPPHANVKGVDPRKEAPK